MAAFIAEALGKHDRSAFTGGNARIDGYVRDTVSQDVKRGCAACHVLIDDTSGRIAGFYTLSSHSIPLTELPTDVARKLPRYPSVPAVPIGWLGRAADFRGLPVGSMLLADAIDDKAAAFYREHQFQPIACRPRAFLPADADRARAGPAGHAQGSIVNSRALHLHHHMPRHRVVLQRIQAQVLAVARGLQAAMRHLVDEHEVGVDQVQPWRSRSRSRWGAISSVPPITLQTSPATRPARQRVSPSRQRV